MGSCLLLSAPFFTFISSLYRLKIKQFFSQSCTLHCTNIVQQLPKLDFLRISKLRLNKPNITMSTHLNPLLLHKQKKKKKKLKETKLLATSNVLFMSRFTNLSQNIALVSFISVQSGMKGNIEQY
jgi:hypothetical protein